MKIAFYGNYNAIGDICVLLPALFALCKLYPNAEITFLTTHKGEQFAKNSNFTTNITILNEQSLHTFLQSTNLNFFILANPKTDIIKLLKKANIDKVITFWHLHNLIARKFKILPTNRWKQADRERYLRLIRAIDEKHYDSNIHLCDFHEIALHTKKENQNKIKNILCPLEIQKYSKIININAYCHSADSNYNLKEQDWWELLLEFALIYPQFLFIWTTYGNKTSPAYQLKNIFVYHNGSDIFDLIELTKIFDCIISPSTGNISLADIMAKRIIAFYPYYDVIRYPCGNFNNPFTYYCVNKRWKSKYQYHIKHFKICIKKTLDNLILVANP
ncbi:glycosyltransferase family 9 protein [Helicobacter turcicus]|uniref:Lipopolysaccharide heptosyltransferase family protein n=1 Tax=Helicobacter turcicus TaxID=2867412 RepID=A0ABS7JM38_9HELI|nr:hypothetical protein [Helicobacter turcicus]MBX7490457.1 hypothetical protein [Helicobacter turcicus]MBX7545317.1 hypothetical protein [Helicobacter turcicus]